MKMALAYQTAPYIIIYQVTVHELVPSLNPLLKNGFLSFYHFFHEDLKAFLKGEGNDL